MQTATPPSASITFEDGSTYDGDVNHANKPHGSGTLRPGPGSADSREFISYVGDFRDGKRHGWGVMKYAADACGLSSVYDGEWRDGRRHGFGTMASGGGSRYEGTW